MVTKANKIKKKTIRWKHRPSVNTWEGTISGDKEPLLFIEGQLCLTDIRANRASTVFVSPSHYTINSLENGKQIALDLINGDNLEIHEQNRQAWENRLNESAKLIQDVDKLIAELKAKK